MAYNYEKKMSLRATMAYMDEEKKITDFGKADLDYLVSKLEEDGKEIKGLSIMRMRAFLKRMGASSWHHTGMNYRKTDFYSIDNALTGAIPGMYEYGVDDEAIEALEAVTA